MNPAQRGYTLVELIVSVAIFSIVMLVASAAFLALINLDRQARATNDVVTNLSYVIESMERSIRTGTNYQNVWWSSSFCFRDASGRIVEYQLAAQQIQERISTGSSCSSITSLGSWVNLTDPRVRVTNLDFYARGTASETQGDALHLQPYVIFAIRGTVQPDSRSPAVEFAIQSSAVQRIIDL